MIVIPLVTATTVEPWLTLKVSPVASDRVLTVIDARGLFSVSVNRKSDNANVLAVSSLVVTLLASATGTSFTAVTLIVIVAATVPLAESFTLKSNVLRAAPLALAAGV